MKLEKVVSDLGSLIELEGLQLDETGVCGFCVDKEFHVTLQTGVDETDDGIWVVVEVDEVAELSEEQRLAQLEAVLSANLVGSGSGKGRFAFDVLLDRIVLTQQFSQSSVSGKLLADDIAELISYAKYWKAEFSSNRG